MPSELPDDDPTAPVEPDRADAEPSGTEGTADQAADAGPADEEPGDEEPRDEEPGDEEPPVPSEAELERTATPATVRRAPKFSAFMIVGALVGIVVALVLAVLVHGGDCSRPDGPASCVGAGTGFVSFLDGEGAIRWVLAVTGAVVGAFAGGALAVLADRRSRSPR
ncbi:histidine kinase [Cellulomonas sp. HZM]|uniref:histidine kinase n=1 Tax=Cellulomonas sp. HZM TaxID=1454010 RepID=UPI000A981B0C|nr:histidine kinase [Cellulomonas sp. HZM]